MSSGSPSKGSVYRGAAIAVALTWVLRAIGLVSVFILARLLTPADFGVVGLAMTAVALVETFSYLGMKQALLRMEEPERDYYDTAFTIQLIMFSALGLLLFAIAAPAADFFREPRVEPVVYALSLRFVMLGLVNIGVVEFERDFAFAQDLKMKATARIVSFFVTVALALWLRSYWALVVGMIVQSLILTVLSYTMQPFRPRLSLVRRAELLGVSLWIFAGVVAQVFYGQVERIVVGRTADTGTVGAFSVSKDVSNILTQEIAMALNRVTFVTTARSGAFDTQGERIALSLGAYSMITASMGLGLAAVAEHFIRVFLGGQWGSAVPLVAPIAIGTALMAVFRLIASSLQAGGHEKSSALLCLAGLAGLAAAVGIVAQFGGTPLDIAHTGLIVSAMTLFAGLVVLAHFSRYRLSGFLVAVARPYLAATAMYFCVRALPALTPSPLVELLWRAALGAAIYFSAVMLLWLLSGRPQSSEAEMLRVARRLLARF
ncbi:oligosaccharide flippase family protein [Qipengyuania gaetbuli]|uniref:oligosaccharide flippase family protein n=1 Tax=Qipengyuania gaetbuli TaxID=266952 RepID=UPI001CD7BB5B|nr:oligosaccharide flippase family protein [Qipengyuania gaetbuli]MCA0909137.1 oligosaccharide flippase family protein [Qipengyuania gaetbuli]